MPGEPIPLILSALLALGLASISILHIHWAGGGKWGLENAIPTTEDGKPIFSPKPGSTLFIGALLAAGALTALERGFLWPGLIPPHLLNTGCWIFSAVFAARTVGDSPSWDCSAGSKVPRFPGWMHNSTPLCAPHFPLVFYC